MAPDMVATKKYFCQAFNYDDNIGLFLFEFQKLTFCQNKARTRIYIYKKPQF